MQRVWSMTFPHCTDSDIGGKVSRSRDGAAVRRYGQSDFLPGQVGWAVSASIVSVIFEAPQWHTFAIVWREFVCGDIPRIGDGARRSAAGPGSCYAPRYAAGCAAPGQGRVFDMLLATTS